MGYVCEILTFSFRVINGEKFYKGLTLLIHSRQFCAITPQFWNEEIRHKKIRTLNSGKGLLVVLIQGRRETLMRTLTPKGKGEQQKFLITMKKQRVRGKRLLFPRKMGKGKKTRAEKVRRKRR
jgi:hypothetical protein